jgi:hypothetical protein
MAWPQGNAVVRALIDRRDQTLTVLHDDPCAESGRIRSIALSGSQLATFVCTDRYWSSDKTELTVGQVLTTLLASRLGLRQYVLLPVEPRPYLFMISALTVPRRGGPGPPAFSRASSSPQIPQAEK